VDPRRGRRLYGDVERKQRLQSLFGRRIGMVFLVRLSLLLVSLKQSNKTWPTGIMGTKRSMKQHISSFFLRLFETSHRLVSQPALWAQQDQYTCLKKDIRFSKALFAILNSLLPQHWVKLSAAHTCFLTTTMHSFSCYARIVKYGELVKPSTYLVRHRPY